MRQLKWFLPLGVLLFFCSQCYQIGPPGGTTDAWATDRRQPIASSGPAVTRTTGTASVSSLMRDANVRTDLVRKGTYGRRVIKPMRARYITIHSTQNYSADAARHAVALKRGALRTGRKNGYMIWHFTVDDRVAIQHLPTSEQGVHADFDGPGNRYSIGIEMCEHRGCSREATLNRTAKLTAALMKRNGIPLRNVVPHYHWPRIGKKPPNKNCPHFLLDNGRPGKKWRSFLARVNYQYQRLE